LEQVQLHDTRVHGDGPIKLTRDPNTFTQTIFLYDELPADYPEAVSSPELDGQMRTLLTPEGAQFHGTHSLDGGTKAIQVAWADQQSTRTRRRRIAAPRGRDGSFARGRLGVRSGWSPTALADALRVQPMTRRPPALAPPLRPPADRLRARADADRELAQLRSISSRAASNNSCGVRAWHRRARTRPSTATGTARSTTALPSTPVDPAEPGAAPADDDSPNSPPISRQSASSAVRPALG
jgi:hypothetical protein